MSTRALRCSCPVVLVLLLASCSSEPPRSPLSEPLRTSTSGGPGTGGQDGSPMTPAEAGAGASDAFTEWLNLEVTVGVGAGLPEAPRVLLLGYAPRAEALEVLPPGEPPGWTTELSLAAEEPELRQELSIPSPAVLFAALDVDGDGQPGPSDALSSPVVLEEGLAPTGGLSFSLTEAGLGWTARQAEARQAQPRGPSGSGVMVTPPGTEPLTLRIDLDRLPRTEGSPSGRLVVVGFESIDPGEGMPTPGAQPLFYWIGPRLQQPRWPVRTEAVFPTNLDVLVSVDLDENGRLSEGDLLGGPLLDFQPPTDSSRLSYVLDRLVEGPPPEEPPSESAEAAPPADSPSPPLEPSSEPETPSGESP